MAQSGSEATDGRRAGPQNKDEALSVEVRENGEGVSINVYRGMDLVESTWETWAEMGVEPMSETSVRDRQMFHFAEEVEREDAGDEHTTEEDAE